MRTSRNILLLVLAACLALAALAAPLIWKGLVQKRIERAVADAGGNVSYSPGVNSMEIQRLVARAVGPQFLADIFHASLADITTPRATYEALQALGDLPALENLDVCGDGVDAACLEKVADLKALSLLRIFVGTAPDFSPLARSTSIKVLVLQDVHGVTPGLLAQMARIPNLGYLALWGTDMEGCSLAGFRDFAHLEMLDLSSISITTDDLAALADAPALRTVTVNDAISGTQSLEEIQKKLPHITIERRR